MEEQVFDGGDALFGEGVRDLRADAFDELNGSIELDHISRVAEKRSVTKRSVKVRSVKTRLINF
jgi:hypothetical protein